MLWGQVRRKLGYSCSAGVAHNKLLAKLGCGLHKPNQQVRTLPLALSLFLVLFLFLSLCPSVSRPRASVVARRFSSPSIGRLDRVFVLGPAL